MKRIYKLTALSLLSYFLTIVPLSDSVASSHGAAKGFGNTATKETAQAGTNPSAQDLMSDANEEQAQEFYSMNEYEIKGLPKEQKAGYFEALAKHLAEMKSDTAEKFTAPSIADLETLSKSPVNWDLFIRSLDKLCTTVKTNESVCKTIAQDRVNALRAGATH